MEQFLRFERYGEIRSFRHSIEILVIQPVPILLKYLQLTWLICVHVLKFVTAVDVNGQNEIDSGGNVVNLNDSNFETTVLNSGDKWLVEFFSPYCRKCKKFKPQWNQAAAKLKDKIKVSKNFRINHLQFKFGALDVIANPGMAKKFIIRALPTIKYFDSGSSADDAVNYDGGMASTDIVQWVLDKIDRRRSEL
ncbi:unnamed protein product [Enterobius vermicularis]|uniref:Protein disulfide-isomerase n=1 Tax=Enterobius vermicularis TaxID=51028 RepID=A0A0N4V5W6_ENTVE|nr:unnamed protein product [Enterobius vermicularis]